MGREEERICKPGSAADLPFGHLASFCPWQWMSTKNVFLPNLAILIFTLINYFKQQLMQIRIIFILEKSLQLNFF